MDDTDNTDNMDLLLHFGITSDDDQDKIRTVVDSVVVAISSYGETMLNHGKFLQNLQLVVIICWSTLIGFNITVMPVYLTMLIYFLGIVPRAYKITSIHESMTYITHIINDPDVEEIRLNSVNRRTIKADRANYMLSIYAKFSIDIF